MAADSLRLPAKATHARLPVTSARNVRKWPCRMPAYPRRTSRGRAGAAGGDGSAGGGQAGAFQAVVSPSSQAGGSSAASHSSRSDCGAARSRSSTAMLVAEWRSE